MPAVKLIAEFLGDIGISEVLWLLDSPVSNSRRLKTLIGELARQNAWDWEVRLSLSPDAELKDTELTVVSSDSVILDACTSWANLAAEIITKRLSSANVVGFSDRNSISKRANEKRT